MAKAQTATRTAAPFDLDPFRWLWRFLTSIRIALILIAFLTVSALLGVLIPQIPQPMRDNAAAVSVWLDFQRETFGVLTGPMHRFGLFNVFGSAWFTAGLAVLVAAVTVCTANRFPPIWRNVTRPQKRVPDAYLERSNRSIALKLENEDAVVRELQRRRYKVTTFGEGATTYLFADRFPWAQLATFVSHLALILFLAGGLLTVIAASEARVFVAEGTTMPVFDITSPRQMQVYVEDAVGRFDTTGFPLDYRSQIVVYQGGQEVARGVSTVNDPLSYGGYKFHQSAYFADGAALRVRDLVTGNVIYDEVLVLDDATAAPRIVVRDGNDIVLLSDAIVPTDFLPEASGSLVALPDGRRLWVGVKPDASKSSWELVVFEASSSSGARLVMREGERGAIGGGLSLSFVGVAGLPSLIARNIPGTPNEAIAQLSDGPQGKLLTVGPVQGQALALSEGQPIVIDGREYTFLGQREFAGPDGAAGPGLNVIWAATGLLLLGLMLTFYTPRRRLWGKIANGQAYFRGLGGRAAAIERELRQAARQKNEER